MGGGVLKNETREGGPKWSFELPLRLSYIRGSGQDKFCKALRVLMFNQKSFSLVLVIPYIVYTGIINWLKIGFNNFDLEFKENCRCFGSVWAK
jgi:hypothetical protein